MKRATILRSVAIVLSLAGGTAAAQVGGAFELTWSTVDAGGAKQSGGAFALVAASGQAEASLSTGGTYAHDGGFAPGVCGGTVTPYGSGCPGTGGFVPQLTLRGCPANGYGESIEVSGGLPGAPAFLFIGFGKAALPMGGGCTLNVFPLFPATIGPLPLIGAGPGNGAFALPVTVPTSVPSVILPVTLQAFVTDPGAPGGTGFSNSNGVELIHA